MHISGVNMECKVLYMSRNKPLGKKNKLISSGKKRSAPRWADIKKFGLKHARTRRIRTKVRRWRKDKLKI